MIRTERHPSIARRTLLRGLFFTAAGLAGAEILATVAPFLKVQRVLGLGEPIPVGTKASILERFAATNDAPILFSQGRFFLIHPPGGIVAAYRKCTHLGCAVPFNPTEDQFHCPCHGSIYDKRTAVVIRDPAPKPLQLFHIREAASGLIVDTNPLNVIDRTDNRWDPKVIEVSDQSA